METPEQVISGAMQKGAEQCAGMIKEALVENMEEMGDKSMACKDFAKVADIVIIHTLDMIKTWDVEEVGNE